MGRTSIQADGQFLCSELCQSVRGFSEFPQPLVKPPTFYPEMRLCISQTYLSVFGEAPVDIVPAQCWVRVDPEPNSVKGLIPTE